MLVHPQIPTYSRKLCARIKNRIASSHGSCNKTWTDEMKPEKVSLKTILQTSSKSSNLPSRQPACSNRYTSSTCALQGSGGTEEFASCALSHGAMLLYAVFKAKARDTMISSCTLFCSQSPAVTSLDLSIWDDQCLGLREVGA